MPQIVIADVPQAILFQLLCKGLGHIVGIDIKAIQNELKAHMDARSMDTLLGFDWKVIWKAVTAFRRFYVA